MKPITNSSAGERVEALAWLAGALRWERVLDDLRAGASGDDVVATEPVHATPEPAPAPADLPARRSVAA